MKRENKIIVITIVVGLLLRAFIFGNTLVKGKSMEPTLIEGDRIFTNKISLYFSSPNRGDIIGLVAPDEDVKYVKRVIAIEGDIVEIVDGRIILNGDVIEEKYTHKDIYTFTDEEQNKWVIPKDHVFVVGDNRGENESYDSRYFGSIHIKDVDEIMTFRYFPFNKMGKIEK